MLRVIAGTAKGTRLLTPDASTRPTLDRVREALFSILHPHIASARFLDLYAGSGANGIEALSRGAAYCAFVDSSPTAIHTIGENLSRAKLEHKSRSYRLTLPVGLGVLVKSEEPFDIVFCDPPYLGTDYRELIAQVIENKMLANTGRLVVEHDLTISLPDSIEGLKRLRLSRYGRVNISIFA